MFIVLVVACNWLSVFIVYLAMKPTTFCFEPFTVPAKTVKQLPFVKL